MVSSSSDALVGDYEVFLSFRGEDTRQGFTDILYEKMTMVDIRVFRDDDELAIGDKIESILEAINNSKICIPIFSPRFAESKWCLREVSRMVELKKKIVPVFYKVTPNDVKLKGTSLYFEDFKKLEENHGDHEEIAKWKNGLSEAASNKGRELGGNSYTKFCKKLVEEILSKLGPRKRLEIDQFVGLDNKREAMKLLDMESREGVIYLGLYGMGGVGKTTIAKLIYNEFLSSFDHCSFIPDIREFSRSSGVKDLPKYLYDNLEPKSVDEFSRSEQIPGKFKNKKVLFILDDVDSHNQIREIAKDPSSWFGSGSRIIVTTRDKNVLQDYETESGSEIRKMEMEELERVWSLKLFSRCAFGKNSPPSSYQDLSERAVAFAGGLPLAITVIAKYLRNKKESVWEEIIERLKKTPPKEVKDKLLISYEVLEDEQKKIFLDIACLFIGQVCTETSNVFYMWQDCGLCPRWSLEVLQSRSLVKTDKYGCLKMHDQLRDLGRDIVRKESGGDLTKQSRLWEEKEALDVLKCKEKKKKYIEALQFGYFFNENKKKDNFTSEEVSSFDSLRFLKLGYDIRLQGRFFGLLPELRWLQCRYILEARNLVPSNLVILNLSGSDISENWEGWSQIQVLKKLKVLDLSGCRNLGQTPVFTEDMALERLDLGSCYNLAYIDPSIGKLQHLNYLNFSDCNQLKNLPESLGELHSLRELNLSGAIHIANLPDSIDKLEALGNLRSLVRLDISYTKITRLPSSIGELEKLEVLNLEGCRSLVDLPQSLGNLRSLVDLDIRNTEITRLPSSIGGLEKLEVLNLKGCTSLVDLPQSLGNLRSLVDLDIRNTEITRLPSSIGGLEKLYSLDLHGLNITQLPDSFGDLRSLVDLDLSGSEITVLPSTIHKLSLLQTLKLDNCVKLQELPELPTSLTKLNVKSDALKKVPDLSNLPGLTSLELISCDSILDSNGSFPDLSGLRKLVTLRIESFRELIEIPGIGKLHCLTSLCIRDCPSLVKLENLRELQALWELELFRCDKLTEIPGLGELRHLTRVIVKSHALRELELEDLGEIKEISLIGCLGLTRVIVKSHALVKVPILSWLSNLRDLKLIDGSHWMEKKVIIESSNLKGIVSLTRLENLELRISNLSALPLDLSGLSALSSLVIVCPSFKCRPLYLTSSLQHLELTSYNSKLKLTNLSHLRNLESLVIGGHTFTDLSELQLLESLKFLTLWNCRTPSSDSLPPLKNLIHLKLIRCRVLTEISSPGGLDSLETLHIELCESLESIGNLFELKKLVEVTICCCPKLHIEPYNKVVTSTRSPQWLGEEIKPGENDVWELIKQGDLKTSEYLAWWEESYKKMNFKQEIPTISPENMIYFDDDDDDEFTVYDDDDVIVKYDLSMLLSSRLERDFLIRNNGRQVETDRAITFNRGRSRLVLMFSASWCVSSHLLTLVMKESFKGEYGGDVVVFVSVDDDEESFTNYFSMMPWLAIPFSDSDKRNSLVELFNVTEIPHLVFFDRDGNVRRTTGTCFKREGRLTRAEASRKNQSLRSTLVRETLDLVHAFGGGGEPRVPVSEQLEGKEKIIGIYFSCKSSTSSVAEFNKRLIEVYKELKNKGEIFEIVVIPHINDHKALFLESWDDFLVLPMNINRYTNLFYEFEVRNLPALVIIGPNGETLCSDAVYAFKEYGAAAYPFTSEKLAEIDREAADWKEPAWRKQSLRSVLHVHGGSLDYVLSFDGRKVPVSELEGKVVGLYFSYYSESCIEFTLELLDVYEKLNKETTFEIVSVFLPRNVYNYSHIDEQSFWESFGNTIPWLALQISLVRAKELVSYFEISTLPALVIIGQDGKILHLNGVDLIKEHGVRAYPFTPERLTQMVNAKEFSEEEGREANMLWSKKLQHHLHVHQLVPSLRRSYECDGCGKYGKVWSYYCEECDFDLHYQCATLTRRSSSIPGQGDPQFFENQTGDAEGNNEDMQGQLLDLHKSHDHASCSEHVNGEEEEEEVCPKKQSPVSSGSPCGISCLDWSCCLAFFSLFRS